MKIITANYTRMMPQHRMFLLRNEDKLGVTTCISSKLMRLEKLLTEKIQPKHTPPEVIRKD